MTTNKYAQFVLKVKKETYPPQVIEESAAYEAAQLISFILTNAIDFTISAQFTEMSANDVFVPILSDAIIEDWLYYDTNYEATESPYCA